MLEERHRLESALGETRDREGEARARLVDLERAVAALRAERETEAAALTARVEVVAAERDRLKAALAAVQAERDYFAADEAAADAAHARLEDALVREVAARGPTDGEEPSEPPPAKPMPIEIRVEPAPASVAAAAPAEARAAMGGRRIVVLDDAGRGERGASRRGGDPPLAEGGDGGPRRADGARPHPRQPRGPRGDGRAHGAARLRLSGRFTGCILAPGADRALLLGTIEPVGRRRSRTPCSRRSRASRPAGRAC